MTYLTAFNTFGREAYAYVAKEKGFFAEQGLDVDIQVGTGSGENMAALASGAAQFAPVDSTGYMLTKAKGDIAGITAIAAVQQRSMVGIMTLNDTGITTPKDLEGKKLGDQAGATTTILFPLYAKLAGFDHTKVEIIPTGAGDLGPALGQKKVDAIGQFVVGQPLIEKAAGGGTRKAVSLAFSDVITDLYGHFLLTSDKIATEQPEMAQKFATALLKGMDYAINNPQESAEILAKAVPETDVEVAAAEMVIMKTYTVGDAPKLGIVDQERVAKVIAILEGAEAIPAGKTPAEFVKIDIAPKA
ncbi:ABC transporter substrate-binding protein [Catenuloplanes atrovinosus]|uniref:NitT/TauT family transport system substrate-binding protein n=1 Tax=Catenuloplanes atrovinosus TaxID=137266 RepID=A0AAE3YT33_9ACTN|nr:ABC transporter substrate-binding protein [Catenuloplanes atrovinosus]MDR7279428.1 NitT/TauT family transport system substrate-binding protein [Catenuloplanes atrovinosus]